MPVDPERIGLDPFASPLSVLHVVDTPAAAVHGRVPELAAAHRARGWRVEVATAGHDVAGYGAAGYGAAGHDVLVLHGPGAGRLRHRVRGALTTVVVAAPGSPRGTELLVERGLARWTNVVVVPDGATADRWTRRVPVPLVRLGAVDGPDHEAMAAVLVRAGAFGGS